MVSLVSLTERDRGELRGHAHPAVKGLVYRAPVSDFHETLPLGVVEISLQVQLPVDLVESRAPRIASVPVFGM